MTGNFVHQSWNPDKRDLSRESTTNFIVFVETFQLPGYIPERIDN